jgi:hypothetical protein
MMSEKPILFSAEMVRAILDGRKTQTRRVIKPQPPDRGIDTIELENGILSVTGDSPTQWMGNVQMNDWYYEQRCPFSVGQHLWVRETWCSFPASAPDGMGQNVYYRASQKNTELSQEVMLQNGIKWRPSIFMPRWASRMMLKITDVRVERLQDITPADCKAEGVFIPHPVSPTAEEALRHLAEYKSAFEKLWDGINSKRGYPWSSNPWLWVVCFEVLAAKQEAR